MVMDRLLFILFTAVNLIGTLAIFLHSPSIFDTRQPIALQPSIKPLTADIYPKSLFLQQGTIEYERAYNLSKCPSFQE